MTNLLRKALVMEKISRIGDHHADAAINRINELEEMRAVEDAVKPEQEHYSALGRTENLDPRVLEPVKGNKDYYVYQRGIPRNAPRDRFYNDSEPQELSQLLGLKHKPRIRNRQGITDVKFSESDDKDPYVASYSGFGNQVTIDPKRAVRAVQEGRADSIEDILRHELQHSEQFKPLDDDELIDHTMQRENADYEGRIPDVPVEEIDAILAQDNPFKSSYFGILSTKKQKAIYEYLKENLSPEDFAKIEKDFWRRHERAQQREKKEAFEQALRDELFGQGP